MDVTNNIPLKTSVFPYQLIYNVIPHIDSFLDNGYSKEEMKINWEINKILGENILISCTCVRVKNSIIIGSSFKSPFRKHYCRDGSTNNSREFKGGLDEK